MAHDIGAGGGVGVGDAVGDVVRGNNGADSSRGSHGGGYLGVLAVALEIRATCGGRRTALSWRLLEGSPLRIAGVPVITRGVDRAGDNYAGDSEWCATCALHTVLYAVLYSGGRGEQAPFATHVRID